MDPRHRPSTSPAAPGTSTGRRARRAPAVASALPALCIAFAAGAQTPASPPPADGPQLYQANCARCHSSDASGTANGPNLLRRVAGMSQERFVEAVLHRYSWTLPAVEAGGETTALREAMARGLIERRADAAAMPAWSSDPAVRDGVGQLYRHLRDLAKAQR